MIQKITGNTSPQSFNWLEKKESNDIYDKFETL